jgi:hypothetical protein
MTFKAAVPATEYLAPETPEPFKVYVVREDNIDFDSCPVFTRKELATKHATGRGEWGSAASVTEAWAITIGSLTFLLAHNNLIRPMAGEETSEQATRRRALSKLTAEDRKLLNLLP